jgi:iron complex transport system ATP-binding protein
VISLRGVSIDVDGRRIVDGLDLDVASGEWVCILGPNGAGKSTTVRAIAGLWAHDGTIVLEDRDTGRLRPRERALLVAVVPQIPVIPAGMTVRDYLLLGRTPHLSRFGTERSEDHAVVGQVMRRLDLTAMADRSVDSLSGGERQRAVLGRALAQEAPVLVLDEPTSALDIGHQQDVLDLVDDLRLERGLTVLSTMHDLTLAGQYADRLVLLADGRIVAAGTATEVLEPEVLRTHFGVNVRVLHEPEGISVLPIRPDRASTP